MYLSKGEDQGNQEPSVSKVFRMSSTGPLGFDLTCWLLQLLPLPLSLCNFLALSPLLGSYLPSLLFASARVYVRASASADLPDCLKADRQTVCFVSS